MGEDWLGVEIAGYRIDALIGRGGAGVVYRATHLRLQRVAALKLLAPALAGDEDYRLRFEREARLAAGLEHPNIVPIYDAGHDHDVLYLAMRYVAGHNLATLLDTEGIFELPRLFQLLMGIAEALDTAHRAGLVHRDIKPANILVTTAQSDHRERAYLCDFGIARATSTTSIHTTVGQFLGTLHYCAPEQIQGQALDGRADQYALACVVFQCLTGQVPFPVEGPAAIMFAHISTEPPRPSAQIPALPPTLDDIIARALAKQPDHRYPNCVSFLRALAGVETDPASPPPASTATPAPDPGTSDTLIWPGAASPPVAPPDPGAQRKALSPLESVGAVISEFSARNHRFLATVTGLLLLLAGGLMLLRSPYVAIPAARAILLVIGGAVYLWPSKGRLLGAGWLLGTFWAIAFEVYGIVMSFDEATSYKLLPDSEVSHAWYLTLGAEEWVRLSALTAWGIAFVAGMVTLVGHPGGWFIRRTSPEARTLIILAVGVVLPTLTAALATQSALLLIGLALFVAALLCTRLWLRFAVAVGTAASWASFIWHPTITASLGSLTRAASGIGAAIFGAIAVLSYWALRKCSDESL